MRCATTILLLAVMASAGCEFDNEFGAGGREPRKTAKDIEIERLQAEADDLHAQLKERGDDYKKLETELTRLEFTNDQLNKQIKAVGDAPRERDKYRRSAIDLMLKVERLKQRIATLEELLGIPASRPAKGDNAPASDEPKPVGKGK